MHALILICNRRLTLSLYLKVQGMDDDVHFKAFIETLNSVSTNSKANSDNLEQVVYALVEEAVRNNEQADIDEQKKV